MRLKNIRYIPNIIIFFVLLSTAASAADIITFKSGMLFDHQGHKREVGMCSYCHTGNPGVIDGFGREWAHKTCIACHIDFKEGPQTCDGCHPSHLKKG